MSLDKRLQQLINSYDRLEEALSISLSEPLALDGTIKRFEFTFETTWKTLKVYLTDQGIQCQSPKSCLKGAFKMGWIKDEDQWLSMLQARNMTSHVYNEEMAKEIYNTIKGNHLLFKKLIVVLQNY